MNSIFNPRTNSTWSVFRRNQSLNLLGYRTTPGMLGAAAYWAGILCVAFLGGWILGKGVIIFDALLFALFAGILVISMPLEWLVIGLLVMAWVIAPSVGYFLGVQQTSYVAPAFAIVVFAKLFLVSALDREKAGSKRPKATGSQSITWAVYAYLSSILVSLIVNQPPVHQGLLAIKFYFPFWSLFFAITFGFLSRDFIARVWRWLVPLAVLQLPFTVYQHFVIAPTRPDADTQNAADAVVGTFGGDPMAGGNSGTLMIFLIAGMVVALALSRSGRISQRFLRIALLTSFLALMMGETKAAFLLLPAALMVLDLRLIMARPARLLAIILIGGPALFGLYKTYQFMYWGEDKPSYASSGSSSPLHHFDYILDPTNYDLKSGYVDRGAAIAIWWTDPQADFHTRLIGYGPLASRSQGFIVGNIAKRYQPLAIAGHTSVTLLWDVGILGAVAFTSILIFSFISGLQRLPSVGSDEQAHILGAATAVTTTLIATLVYNGSLVTDSASQVLLMLCIGTIYTFPASLPEHQKQSAQSESPGRAGGLPQRVTPLYRSNPHGAKSRRVSRQPNPAELAGIGDDI